VIAIRHCLDPKKRNSPEFCYVAAACSLRMSYVKFKSRSWAASLQHADAALNCMKLLRAKVKLFEHSELHLQAYMLLPALSPQSKELSPSTAVE
jgi:hypothetical protein